LAVGSPLGFDQTGGHRALIYAHRKADLGGGEPVERRGWVWEGQLASGSGFPEALGPVEYGDLLRLGEHPGDDGQPLPPRLLLGKMASEFHKVNPGGLGL
jgi:hypothetical protein